MKHCKTCQTDHPREHFYKCNQNRDGLTYKCRDCIRAGRKVYDQKYNQSEKAKTNAKRYYYSEKGQAAKKAYREQYEMTPEQQDQYRVAMRAHEKKPKYKARRKRYDQSPKGQAAKAGRDKRYFSTEAGRFVKRKVEIKRKHQMKAAACTLTRKEWREIKERFGHSCAYCTKQLQRLEMDHVIPLSKGGNHTASNVVPACRTCNAKKGARILTAICQSAGSQEQPRA